MATKKANGRGGKAHALAAGRKKSSVAHKHRPDPANDRKPPSLHSEIVADPAAAAAPSLRIFQIYYDAWQRDLIDPQFVPLDNRGMPSELLEFDLFNRLFLSAHVRDVGHWGALSWRFTEKTGLKADDLVSAIAGNPGHDVYFCNPYPANEALFHNLWVQGETAHPDFLRLSRAFLEAAGLPVEEVDLIWPSASFSAANYFVGNQAFWRAYLAFVGKAIRDAEAALPAEVKAELHSSRADDHGIHGGTTYMPFIVERLFPLFMRTAGSGLKGFKIPLPLGEEQMDVHLKLLTQMKDVAHRTRSPWLAACWANYRSLYFTQLHGPRWTQKYLRAITPADIKFA